MRPTTRNARDGANYVRVQKGHSVVLHLLFGWMALYTLTLYYIISPNHYWHL